MMRGLVLESVGSFAVHDVPDPHVGPNDALVSVAWSGICGSELGGFQGTDGLRHPGLVFGHEFVGEVVDYGLAVAPSLRLPPGTLVTANPMRVCGRCRLCRSGSENVCQQRQLLGAHVHGSNAELVAVPAAALLRVDQGSDPMAGVLTEPAACALRAVRQTKAGPGSSALVIGAGPIGLLLIEILQMYGVRPVWFTEHEEGRVNAALAAGAQRLGSAAVDLVAEVRELTEGLGVDVAFDAVGSASTRETVAACTRPGGEAVFVGLHSAAAELPVRDLIRREITCATSFAYSADDFTAAWSLLMSGQLTFGGQMVRADLGDGQAWYEKLIAGSPVSKVLLSPRTDLDLEGTA